MYMSTYLAVNCAIFAPFSLFASSLALVLVLVLLLHPWIRGVSLPQQNLSTVQTYIGELQGWGPTCE